MYYAVAKGRKAAVYEKWNDCKTQVHGYPNAKYKKFNTRAEAENFVRGGLDTSLSGSITTRSFGGGNKLSGYSVAKQASKSKPYRNYGLENYSESSILSNSNVVSKSSGSSGSSGSPGSSGSSGSYGKSGLCTLSGLSSKEAASQHGIDFKTEKIFVDGACRGNGKHGNDIPASGYGVYYGVGDPRNAGKSLSTVDNVHRNKPTNQRAELFAVKHALEDIKQSMSDPELVARKFEIHTDSQYSKNCIESWAKNWEKNAWLTSLGKPAENQDIIKPAFKLYTELSNSYPGAVSFVHVKGHLGNYGNDAADALANMGADSMEREFDR